MDINLYYLEQGSGKPLILLHGNGEDSSYFAHQIAFFAAKYRVIAIDTRGHGRSPRGSAPLTIEQLSCDLYAFLQMQGIASAAILGFSDGANIAMKFAIRHPDAVEALILNGGNLNARGVKTSVQLPIEIGYRIAGLFASRSQDAKRHAEILGLMVDEPNIEPQALSQITAPTLVICGTHDMIKQSHTKEIAANLPHARLTWIKGDHFIANKRQMEFNRAVDAFLQEAWGEA